MITRRNFLKTGVAAGVGLVMPFSWYKSSFAQTNAPLFVPVQTPLAGSSIPQFVEKLPELDTIIAGTSQIELQMREFDTHILPVGTLGLTTPIKTRVWGYLQPGQTTRGSYLGPVVVTTRGIPNEFKFVNNLGSTDTSQLLAYTRSTDQTLHWADPLNNEANSGNMAVVPGSPPNPPWDANYSGTIPAAVHLHGGEVPPVLDGGPDSWFTSDGNYKGHAYYSMNGEDTANYAIYRYPNTQEAAPIWFHDHTLGATRLNVYAGLAGGYLITDPVNDPPNLPPLVPLVIQDRMFDTTGQLFFPAGNPYIPNPEHPYWVPEFLGDTICVNGKAWPFLQVEPKRYTFLFLNGSNARTYELFLINQLKGNNGPIMYVIGNDGGYLDYPAKLDPSKGQKLTIMPGERYMVIIDFTGFAGTTLLLRNTAPAPYPTGTSPQGSTTGRVMQFRVSSPSNKVSDSSYNPATSGPVGRAKPMVRLVNPTTGTLNPSVKIDKTRQLSLNEVIDPPITVTVNGTAYVYPGGPQEILVNNTRWDGLQDIGTEKGVVRSDFKEVTVNGVSAYYSETPEEGTTEVWEIVNLTADAHPMHLHLVQFQLLNRQNFKVASYNAAYAMTFPGGLYKPAFGPPLNYNTGNPRALGGNPDITPYLQGAVIAPKTQETGWKDTIMVPPGMVTRIVVRFAPTDLPAGISKGDAFYPFDPNVNGRGYVWHCHIVDHEDNEMMRPTQVIPNTTATRSCNIGGDY